ncbi:unnamed protein product [Cochlearia groenlandica]
MANSTKKRSKIPSRRVRTRPNKATSKRLVPVNVFAEDRPKSLEKKDFENVICSVCMECPHNAVLLLCSSHDKGCRPYMCGTSFRYSNCLDLYNNASAKLKSLAHKQQQPTCPLCRGQVKGWTIVKPARDFMNRKKRLCVQEDCVFAGNFKELRKHMKTEHPCAKPREVNREADQNWRRLEVEQDRNDVISSVRSAMPSGSMMFGDYVVESTNIINGSGENGEIDARLRESLASVFLLLNSLGLEATFDQTGGQSDNLDSDNNVTSVEMNVSVEEEEEVVHSNSLASRMRRQGRVLLGRSERRRRTREANRDADGR